MVGIESFHHQAFVDSVNSKRSAWGKWFKVAAVIGGSCFVLGFITTTSTLRANFHRASIGRPSDFVGLSPVDGQAATTVGISSMSAPVLHQGFRRITTSALEARKLQQRRSGWATRIPTVRAEGAYQNLANLSQSAGIAHELRKENVAGHSGNFFGRPRQYLKARNMAGVTRPLGFFDPLGFSTVSSDGRLLFYRESEVKHGRIAMLATSGMLVSRQLQGFFEGEVPQQKIWAAVLIAAIIPELFDAFRTYEEPDGTNEQWWTVKRDHQPGQPGGFVIYDPLGLRPKDHEQFKKMQSMELNHGRLAMIAAPAIIAQDLATGHALV